MKKLLIGLLLLMPMARAMEKVQKKVKALSLSEDAEEATQGLLKLMKRLTMTQTWIVGQIKGFIKKGAEVNAKYCDCMKGCSGGKTLLHWAAKEGKDLVCEFLVENGADLNSSDCYGMTPARIADSEYHHVLDPWGTKRYGQLSDYELKELAQTYERIPAILNLNSKESNELLEEVGECNPDVDKVLRLIEQGADMNARNVYGNTCLAVAAAATRTPQVVKILIDKGAIIDARGLEGRTPLHYAVEKGVAESCEILLKNEVEVDATDEYGNTPLHYALGEGESPVIYKFNEKAHLLLKSGADLYAKNKYGRTPFYLAVEKGCLKETCRKELLKRTDVNTKDEYGNTSAHYAAWLGLEDLCIEYLDKGTDSSLADQYGRTLFDLSIDKGLDALCAKLIECDKDQGIDLNAKDKSGMTVLHRAAQNRSKDLCQCLIDAGAQIDVRKEGKGDKGATPLHYAVLGGSPDICRMFIEKRADVTAVDDDGKTPLHYIAECDTIDGRPREVVEVLLDNGADIDARDAEGRTPFYCIDRCFKRNEMIWTILFLKEKGALNNKEPKN